MRSLRLYDLGFSVVVVIAMVCVVSLTGSGQNNPDSEKKTKSGSCASHDNGLELPAGFCATLFADGTGHARHLAVAPTGGVYVNSWSGDYYDFDKVHRGGFLLTLQDKPGTGRADGIERLGETMQSGGNDGMVISMYEGSIYPETNDRIVRYALPADAIVPKESPQSDTEKLPVPEGSTADMVALGARIYHGQVGGAGCTGCHGANGTGSQVGPDLTNNKWLWSDGSFAGILKVITNGVPRPKQYRRPMPPMGGAKLSDTQASAVAAYVWGLSRQKPK